MPGTIILKPRSGLFTEEVLAGMGCTKGRLLITRFFLEASLDGTDLFLECHTGKNKKKLVVIFYHGKKEPFFFHFYG